MMRMVILSSSGDSVLNTEGYIHIFYRFVTYLMKGIALFLHYQFHGGIRDEV